MFSNAVRNDMKKEHPEFKRMPQLAKVIGAKWNALPEAQRLEWAAKAKAESLSAAEAFEAISGPVTDGPTGIGSSPKSTPRSLKSPPSIFSSFLA